MIRRVALNWLIAAGILAGSLQTVYLATHTHLRTYGGGGSVSVAGWSVATYHGENTGLVAGAPNGTCAGVEYWQTPHGNVTTVDAYLYTDRC